MSSKKGTSDNNKKETSEKFAPKFDECVYEYFIDNYLTRWFQAKTVKFDVYHRASKELILLKEIMVKKDLKAGKGNPASARETPNLLQDDDISKPAPRSQPKHQRVAEKPQQSPSVSSVSRVQSTQEHSLQILELEQQNVKLKKEINFLKEDLSNAYAQLHDQLSSLRRMREDLKRSIQEANDLKLRLGKPAGDKLQENNPIADLSDPYRPTELGKQFVEIYDNEWSDAFEKIPNKNEEEKVRVLHELVTSSFKYCDEKLRWQVPEIRQILLQLPMQDEGEATKTEKTENIHRTIKELRKAFAPLTAKNVAKNFEEERLEELLKGFGIKPAQTHDSLRKYVRKCTETCWFMVACDPSMALSEDKKDMEFNGDVYKPYTRSLKGLQSPVVELHVWPALHLHYGGPLVAKGVAQPGTKAKK